MMQTLTKTELSWIYNALKHELENNGKVFDESPRGSLEWILAHHNQECIRGVMYKIMTLRNGNAKRVAIE